MRFVTIGLGALLASAAAQGAIIGTISASATAPLTYAVGQPDATGTLVNTVNFTDQFPYPGQVFTSPSTGKLTSLTIKGGGNMGGGYATGSTIAFNVMIASAAYNSIAHTYALTSIQWDSVAGTCGASTDYYTITLNTPIDLTAGSTYAYSLRNGTRPDNTTQGGWFGLARSASDAYAGGAAITRNGTTGTPLAYDYTFYTNIQVPEPATISLLGLGCLALAVRRRQA